MDPIVYIPHLPTRQNPLVNGQWIPTISLTPAAELGTLQVICDLPSDAAPENFEDAQQRVADKLSESSGEDYILMAGDPVLCGFAIHLMLSWFNQARVLRWNRESRSYDLLTLYI